MPIPVLNDKQMVALKSVLNGGKVINLTGGSAKNTRLPTMPEEGSTTINVGSSYNGPFAVHKVGEVMVDISSGEIIPSESGTISAALVTVKNGIITVGDSSWWTTAGPADTSALAIPLPENYTLYLVNSFTSEPAYPHYNNGYEFKALLGAPLIHDDVSYTRLAKNEGGVVKQIQYGDITDLPQFHIPVSASSASFANSARYHGHFAVDFTPNAGVVIDSESQVASCKIYIGNNLSDKMGYGENHHVPLGGYVVQGDKHVAVTDEIMSFTVDFSSNTNPDTYNVYLYKDNTSSSFKYAVLPRQYTPGQVPLDRAMFGQTFYTQLATVRVWRDYAGVDDQGNYIFNYSSSVVQTQFGDVVDCDYGYDDDYLGAFHVRINSNSLVNNDGVISGTFDVHDDYAVPTLEDITGSAGKIIQGANRTLVSGGLNIPFKYYTAYDLNPTNVYLYEDVNSTGDGRWKFFAVDRILRDHPEDIPFSGFCTRIATIGGLGIGKAVERQQQYGDIVDVSVGGSTTIVHSSSITSNIIHSSSVYSSTINVTSTINSSSIVALEYMGAFAVSGSTNSEQLFIASCVDAQGRATGVAGYVINGDSRTAVSEPAPFEMIDGARVYLVGSTDGTTYEIVNMANGGTPTVEEGQFFTQIAYKSGGSIYQTQYGDVVCPNVGGEGGTGDMRAPYFPLLSGDENLLHPCCTYTASADGWVKIATLSSGYCCAIYVTVNGTKYKQGLGVGNGGMAWYIYVRKNNQFYVDAPIGSTRVWFDAECTPAKYAASNDVDLYPVRELAQSTVNLKNSAASYYNYALSAINSASAGADRAESCYTYASNAGIQAVACYNDAVQKTTYQAASETMDAGDVWSGRMSNYVDSVYQCAQAVSSGGSSAAGRSDTVSEYADSANAYYTSTSDANSVLVTLGIAGGTVYVDMASSASYEADDYRTNIDGLIASGETISANSAAAVQTRYNTISAYASAVGDSRNSAWDVINEMPH